MKDPKRFDPALVALTVVSALLLALRWTAAKNVGFGDSEALYATYALHPQPAYLDHPGLIGAFARSLGGGTAPGPMDAHMVTAVLATMAPWIVSVVARSMGATLRASLVAALVAACTPVLSIGLFAMTPDLLLFFAWLGSLGLAVAAVDSPASSGRATAFAMGAGLFAGVAASAKVSGVLLLPTLAWIYARAPEHRRTVWPWLGLGVGLLPLAPIAQWEAGHGWPMLHHRLVATQGEAGFSLRNVLALFGGQLLYLSPLVAVLAFVVARDLVRRRNEDAVTGALFAAFVVPIVPLALLCLWSRVAEPHWLTPPLLALPLHAARTGVPLEIGDAVHARWRSFTFGAAGLGLALTLAVHAWVLVPSLLKYAPRSYDPKVDIANELTGWPEATQSAGELADEVALEVPDAEVFFVAPTWMQCAQLQAAMPARRVGCATDVPSDFDGWTPPAAWRKADVIVFVTDNRFEVEPAKLIPTHDVGRTERISVLRAGRVVRTFRMTVMMKRGAA
jgi:hypothetical protein